MSTWNLETARVDFLKLQEIFATKTDWSYMNFEYPTHIEMRMWKPGLGNAEEPFAIVHIEGVLSAAAEFPLSDVSWRLNEENPLVSTVGKWMRVKDIGEALWRWADDLGSENAVAVCVEHLLNTAEEVVEREGSVEAATVGWGELVCVCENDPGMSGFHAYYNGDLVSPDFGGDWGGSLYCCLDCLRVIDQYSGIVVEHPLRVRWVDAEVRELDPDGPEFLERPME